MPAVTSSGAKQSALDDGPVPAPADTKASRRLVCIGIDPGQNGGMAVLNGDGPPALTAMPATERDVWDWLNDHASSTIGQDTVAVIERVHSFPKQGVASSFKFGQSYGFLRGVLIAAGISFQEVNPEVWQKSLGATTRKQAGSVPAHKKRLKQLAQQMFPNVKVGLKEADALLLAEFCRRKAEGKL